MSVVRESGMALPNKVTHAQTTRCSLFLRSAVVARIGFFGVGIFVELGGIFLGLTSVNSLVD
jgi:hypothetical protein